MKVIRLILSACLIGMTAFQASLAETGVTDPAMAAAQLRPRSKTVPVPAKV